MRPRRLVVVFCSLLAPLAARSQQVQTTTPPQRDPQAVAVLQRALLTMGGSAPADSTATGTVTIVEGSAFQNGTIQILTRGLTQTAETISLPYGQRAVVYAKGDAKETNGDQSTNPPLELIVTDQCPDFPLPFLQSALNNRDAAFRYIGAESLNGTASQHIQLWITFASRPRLQHLAAFSLKDIWFETSSGLPLKITYSRRAGGGAVPGIPVEIFFSSYKTVAGVLYPFQINKSYNGTPWQTITIQNVSFNTGLTDAQFQVQ